MDDIRSAYSKTIFWTQPEGLERRFELRAQESLFAVLVFQSPWGTLATSETAADSWTIKRVGFLNPRVTVRVTGEDENLAIYWPKFWGGGHLKFPDGRQFEWQSTNFWSTEWCFSDAAENRLLQFKPGAEKPGLKEVMKTQAQVEIAPRAFNLPELPLLLVLGWYLLVLYQDDAAAAATTIT